MALYKIYSIANDFPNQKVSSDRLTQEIQASSITVALDSIETHLDDCTITFKAEPSEGEWTTCDSLVAGHTGEAIEYASLVKLDAQTTSDKKPIMLPCLLPRGSNIYISGAGDSSTVRGGGDLIQFESDEAEDLSLEVSFIDPIIILDALVIYEGGVIGDYMGAKIVAPATSVTPNGTNEGNCNLVPVNPGFGIPENTNLVVPAAGDGTHDVDLDAAYPVPHNPDPDAEPSGYWNLSSQTCGKGEVTPNYTGTGSWQLFDKQIDLIVYAAKAHLLGAHDISISQIYAVDPKMVLPFWKGIFTLHNSGHTGLKVVVTLKMGRFVSTN